MSSPSQPGGIWWLDIIATGSEVSTTPCYQTAAGYYQAVTFQHRQLVHSGRKDSLGGPWSQSRSSLWYFFLGQMQKEEHHLGKCVVIPDGIFITPENCFTQTLFFKRQQEQGVAQPADLSSEAPSRGENSPAPKRPSRKSQRTFCNPRSTQNMNQAAPTAPSPFHLSATRAFKEKRKQATCLLSQLQTKQGHFLPINVMNHWVKCLSCITAAIINESDRQGRISTGFSCTASAPVSTEMIKLKSYITDNT